MYNVENLLKLRAIVRRAPSEAIKMESWVDRDHTDLADVPGVSVANPCGTCFCMLGAAALSGEFYGLSLWLLDEQIRFRGSRVAWWASEGFLSYENVADELFGLNPEEAEFLFGSVRNGEVMSDELMLDVLGNLEGPEEPESYRKQVFVDGEGGLKLSEIDQKKIALARLDEILNRARDQA